jgi:hypothetical protein
VYGWPAVIRNEPLDLRGEPHPNLYYLTCPWLVRKLARLEDSGLISKLQLIILENEELREDLRRIQSSHASEYRSALEQAGHDPMPRDMYIAGASDPGLLKCLHSHAAYYLTHPEYLAGREIAAAAGELWCPDDKDRCAAWMNEIKEHQITSPGKGPL